MEKAAAAMVVAAAATAVAVVHTLVFWLNRNSQVALPSPYLLKSQDLVKVPTVIQIRNA